MWVLGKNILYRKRLLGHRELFYQEYTKIIPSIDELKKMLGSNNYIHLMKKKQYGVLTIFLPCSDHFFDPELHWPKFQALFGNVNTDCLEFKSNVVQNPHILN